MKIYKFNRPSKITQEDLDDLLDSAMRGMTNWSDEARVYRDEWKGAEYAHEVITRGGRLLIHDAEDGKWYQLTLKKLIKGLSVYYINLEDYDMYDADAVVQTALFGKVIYG